jgi:hypothetical protein
MPNSINIEQIVNKVSVSSSGPQGPAGAQGIQGPAGGTSGSYAFEQQTASTTWSITHNMGYRPAVFAIDYGGNIIEGDITYSNLNSVVLNFIVAVAGYAYLS